MSKVQELINSPIGAVFFVSGAISVLVLLSIFILKKGNDLHRILGYIFFFGLSFANYSAAISYYEGYLPLAAVSITVPVSSISLFLSLASIIPASKSLLRIRIHIVFSCISATSVGLGTMINYYHFSVLPLDKFRWNDFAYLGMLSIPIFIIGGIIGFYFILKSSSYHVLVPKTNGQNKSKDDLILDGEINARSQTILHDKPREIETALNSRS